VPEESCEQELVAEVDEPGFRARIYRNGSTFQLWVSDVGWFGVDPREPRITVPPVEQTVAREEVLWGVPALLCFLHRGDCSLHAAAVEVDGEAIVLAGPRAKGKSTLAAAFAMRGHRLLSEDLTCIRLAPTPAVVPGPAGLRLRNDVADGLQVPFGRALGEVHGRARYALSDPGDCRPVPISSVLLLASDGDVGLEPVDPARALPDLWEASFRITREHERRSFEAAAELAGAVPIVKLRRPLRLDMLDATVDHVVSQLGGEYD
jgi:hypothetical protein